MSGRRVLILALAVAICETFVSSLSERSIVINVTIFDANAVFVLIF